MHGIISARYHSDTLNDTLHSPQYNDQMINKFGLDFSFLFLYRAKIFVGA